MKIYWRPKTTITCLILSLLMVRASFWQWERHQTKLTYIEQMEARLATPIIPLEELLAEISHGGVPNWDLASYRRVKFSGEFDYGGEVVIRNRRHETEGPGVLALTPMKISNSNDAILINRGFVPLILADPAQRSKIKRPEKLEFIGLIKEPQERRLFAPTDPPTGLALPRVDGFLRPDIKRISAQLSYPVLPVYAELMSDSLATDVKDAIVTSSAGRDEILMLSPKSIQVQSASNTEPDNFPVPMYDTVIPPGRHLGYVYEWAFMALATLAIGVILQLKPPTRAHR
jgi:cytochrome oxidase assembly protein ShyY1